jgi:hypothetical protein
MCACDEMIHSATTTGPPLDVDCEPSRSESFDSEYDVSDSENDACASDSEYHASNSENDACASDSEYHASNSENDAFDSDSKYDVSDSENEVCDSNSECDVSDSDPDCDVSDFHYDSAVNEPGNSDRDVGLLRQHLLQKMKLRSISTFYVYSSVSLEIREKIKSWKMKSGN